jgi:anti-anti-sigma regulatory factor
MSHLRGLQIDQSSIDDVTVVVPRGVLDLHSYPVMRDALVKFALEIPRAVVVDVDELEVPTTATLVVFSSVWMQVSDWPGVAIMLVASRRSDRVRLARSGVGRFVPIHGTVGEAIGAIEEPPPRRRTVIQLSHSLASPAAARRFVARVCARWNCAELTPEAVAVANALVENTIRHTSCEPRLRLELGGGKLTIAVHDGDPVPARLAGADESANGHFGLKLVAALAHAWSCAPMPTGGKVVWAVLRDTKTAGVRPGREG